jgi:site-specific recombinase XerD
MKNGLRLLPFQGQNSTSVPVSDLPRLIDDFLLVGDIARHSQRTLESRRERLGKLLWFVKHKGFTTCALLEIRGFFLYLNHGHKEEGGRWGNPSQIKPLSSGRVKSYYSTLRTFFNWAVKEGILTVSPMAKIELP